MTNTHHSDGTISVAINEVEIIHQTIQGPQGERGEPGLPGQKGEDGKSAKITIGTVTHGDMPSVTNSGTETDVVLDFVLPVATGVGSTDIFANTDALTDMQLRQLNTCSTYLRVGNYILSAFEVRQKPYTFPAPLINAEQQHDLSDTIIKSNTIIKLFDVNDVISEQEQADGWAINQYLFEIKGQSDLPFCYVDHNYCLHLPSGAAGVFTITHPHFDGALTVNIALAP